MAQNGGTSLLPTHQYKIVFRDPQSILEKKFGDGIKVIDFESEPFSKVIDNYGSTILKITVSVEKKDGEKVEKLNLVGKLLPPTDFQRQLFQSDYTFQKEIFFYEQLIPTYQSIYKKKFNIVPQYYGSRMSLQLGASKIDEDTALLLENLKDKGYFMEDRQKGLDLEHLQVVIPAIAKFHAIGLSLKYKKPLFLPVLDKYTRRIATSNVHKKIKEKMLNDIKIHSELNKYYVQIKNLHDSLKDYKIFELEEPWACVVHVDLWNNNMLFHRDENDKIDDVKIVDFQTYSVSSPLTDLIFLLCTSMRYPMEHFDTMIELYRQTAYKTLEELDSDTYLFTKKNFEERLRIDAVTELVHIMVMTFIVEGHEGGNVFSQPANEFVVRRWKRICEIFEQKKWFGID